MRKRHETSDSGALEPQHLAEHQKHLTTTPSHSPISGCEYPNGGRQWMDPGSARRRQVTGQDAMGKNWCIGNFTWSWGGTLVCGDRALEQIAQRRCGSLALWDIQARSCATCRPGMTLLEEWGCTRWSTGVPSSLTHSLSLTCNIVTVHI